MDGPLDGYQSHVASPKQVSFEFLPKYLTGTKW